MLGIQRVKMGKTTTVDMVKHYFASYFKLLRFFVAYFRNDSQLTLISINIIRHAISFHVIHNINIRLVLTPISHFD